MHLACRIHFILQLGYFRAKQLLFQFDFRAVQDDVSYIMTRYFRLIKPPKNLPSRHRITSNNQQILKLYHYRDYCRETKLLIEEKLTQSIRQLNNPLDLFYELLDYRDKAKLLLPSYSTLQDIIGAAIRKEEKRLNACVDKHITQKISGLIDQLLSLKQEDIFYDLTLLKNHPKNFNFKSIQAELMKYHYYYPIYRFTQRFLPKIDISTQNISYYSSLVEHYQIQALKRLEPSRRYFYVLCYAYHRFQKMNDQLIETLMHYVNLYHKQAKEYAHQRANEISVDIKSHYGESAKTLIYWYVDPSLASLNFADLQQRALTILPQEDMMKVGEFLTNEVIDKKRYTWEFHDKNFQAMSKNLRPLMKALDFQAKPEHKELLTGFHFMKKVFHNQQSLKEIPLVDFPLETIPAHLQPYLCERDPSKKSKEKLIKSIHPYRYEFYIYEQLNKHLVANKIYTNDSTQYKNFADDIKLKKTVKEKKQLLTSLNASRLNRKSVALLAELEAELEAGITTTNAHINNDENAFIKIRGSDDKRTWTLPYQKKSDEYNNPFYDKLPLTHLIDTLIAVDNDCHFMESFINIKTHYAKTRQDIQATLACIIANATSLGTYKMGNSSDIPYCFLQPIEQNLIRLDTLRAANDCISNKFPELLVYPYYHLDNQLHGSADGQKFKTRWNTFNSRYSPKYFGLEMGVAPYTLGINYNAVNCIADKGAHQHESHFLFELIQNNTSDIKPDRLSTDTEGSNQIMFVLMYFANIDYTPCYRNLPKKASKMYGFKNLDEYPSDYLIKPIHKINQKLIREEWGNVQDIMLALLSQETSISVITRKLCSNELNDKTKRAMWELNHILRSIYLLRYIDQPDLRGYVRAALNRIEAYHALRRNLAQTNGGEFRGGSDVEVAIWNECGRLVANAVMYYNASLLSKVLGIKEKKGDVMGVKFIGGLSPIASQHLIFGGCYVFNGDSNPINIEEMVQMMDEIDIGEVKKKQKK